MAAQSLVAEILDRTADRVPLDASVQTYPAWDSLAHVKIILEIEARSGRPLDSHEISEISCLDDIAALL